jgi:hypothetical protein
LFSELFSDTPWRTGNQTVANPAFLDPDAPQLHLMVMGWFIDSYILLSLKYLQLLKGVFQN